MVYVPVTYIPDGAVTSALKRRIKGRKPKPQLGNLGPLLDENLVAARKHGHFLYHPDDLRHLPKVDQNPNVVEEGFDVLRAVMAKKDIPEPSGYERKPPHYPDNRRIAKLTAWLAAAMTVAITLAVLWGQEDHVALMTVAICLVSVAGAALFALILSRSVITVQT